AESAARRPPSPPESKVHCLRPDCRENALTGSRRPRKLNKRWSKRFANCGRTRHASRDRTRCRDNVKFQNLVRRSVCHRQPSAQSKICVWAARAQRGCLCKRLSNKKKETRLRAVELISPSPGGPIAPESGACRGHGNGQIDQCPPR